MCAHALGSGAGVPSGEDRGQVRIVLSEAEQHRASGYVPKSSLQVKGDKNTGLVRLRKVLDGPDHLVGSILATHAVLEWARSGYH